MLSAFGRQLKCVPANQGPVRGRSEIGTSFRETLNEARCKGPDPTPTRGYSPGGEVSLTWQPLLLRSFAQQSQAMSCEPTALLGKGGLGSAGRICWDIPCIHSADYLGCPSFDRSGAVVPPALMLCQLMLPSVLSSFSVTYRKGSSVLTGLSELFSSCFSPLGL